MENTTFKTPVMLYTEQTPNPESLKFVSNRMLYAQKTADFRDAEAAKSWSPLANALFEFPYVKGVYICNNFVTVTKEFNYNWDDVMLEVKSFLKKYIDEEKTILNEGYEEAKSALEQQSFVASHGDNAELAQKIKDLIDTYVRPAVEMDGGNIEFQSFENGVVNVILQGSCSGCPSSTVTLKSGIEGMLKRMVPQVTEVIAVAG